MRIKFFASFILDLEKEVLKKIANLQHTTQKNFKKRKKHKMYNSKWLHYLQTLHVYSTLKQRGSIRFHVVSTWNTRGVFVGLLFHDFPACSYSTQKD